MKTWKNRDGTEREVIEWIGEYAFYAGAGKTWVGCPCGIGKTGVYGHGGCSDCGKAWPFEVADRIDLVGGKFYLKPPESVARIERNR